MVMVVRGAGCGGDATAIGRQQYRVHGRRQRTTTTTVQPHIQPCPCRLAHHEAVPHRQRALRSVSARILPRQRYDRQYRPKIRLVILPFVLDPDGYKQKDTKTKYHYRGPGLRQETNHRKMLELGDSVSLVTLRESSPQQTTHVHCTHSRTGHRSTGSVQLADQGLRGCGQSNSRPPACSEYWSVHCLPANRDRCRWRQFVKTATLQAVMMMMMMIFSSGTRFQNENRCSAVSFIYLFI